MQICQSILAEMNSGVFLTWTRQYLIESSSYLGVREQLNCFPVASPSHLTSIVIQTGKEAWFFGNQTGNLTRSTKTKPWCFFQGYKNLKALWNRERPPQRSPYKVKGEMVFSQRILEKKSQTKICVFSTGTRLRFLWFCKPDLPLCTQPYYHMLFVNVSRCQNVGKCVWWITATKDLEHCSSKDSTDPYGFRCPQSTQTSLLLGPEKQLKQLRGKKVLIIGDNTHF